jgi:hypothetical protein
LSQIVFDKELQVRVETDQTTVYEYAEAMATEEDVKRFPPPTVYFDGFRYWLADGHHRYWAADRCGYKTMTVKVIDGTHDDALLAAVKLNSKNGLRFNDDDWEKIIPLIAGKDQWKDWSNRRLADELQCSYKTVERHRPKSSGGTDVPPDKRRGKDGKLYPSTISKKVKPQPVTTEPTPTSLTVTETAGEPAMQTDVAQPNHDEQPTEDKAKVIEERIFEMLSLAADLITEWFDNAPSELHEAFAERVRKQIAAMID